MRKPEFLSPTQVSLWRTDTVEYYIRYLCEHKAPRMAQTRPMSIGSSFDAHIKSYLHERLFGKGHPEASKYSLDSLFESQVEPHNRDWARPHGKYAFDCYLGCGAAADLMLDLEKAIDAPRFEFDLKGVVSGYREGVTKTTLGVPILGKPDLRYINSAGGHVIVDFKVNGYCSNSPTAPKAGYLKCRDAFPKDSFAPSSRGSGQAHKDCLFGEVDGMIINTGSYLESIDPDWARQLSCYGWLMGEPVGKEIVNVIEQIVSKDSMGYVTKNAEGETRYFPLLRVASHRIRTSEGFQFEAFSDFQTLWGILNEPELYFFRDMSFEDSKKKCALIDKQVEIMVKSKPDSDDRWITELARGF